MRTSFHYHSFHAAEANLAEGKHGDKQAGEALASPSAAAAEVEEEEEEEGGRGGGVGGGGGGGGGGVGGGGGGGGGGEEIVGVRCEKVEGRRR